MGPDGFLERARSMFSMKGTCSVKLWRGGSLIVESDGKSVCRIEGAKLDDWPVGVSQWPPRMDEWIEASDTDLGKVGFMLGGPNDNIPFCCEIVQVRRSIEGLSFLVRMLEDSHGTNAEVVYVPKYSAIDSINKRRSELDVVINGVEKEKDRLETLERFLNRRNEELACKTTESKS